MDDTENTIRQQLDMLIEHGKLLSDKLDRGSTHHMPSYPAADGFSGRSDVMDDLLKPRIVPLPTRTPEHISRGPPMSSLAPLSAPVPRRAATSPSTPTHTKKHPYVILQVERVSLLPAYRHLIAAEGELLVRVSGPSPLHRPMLPCRASDRDVEYHDAETFHVHRNDVSGQENEGFRLGGVSFEVIVWDIGDEEPFATAPMPALRCVNEAILVPGLRQELVLAAPHVELTDSRGRAVGSIIVKPTLCADDKTMTAALAQIRATRDRIREGAVPKVTTEVQTTDIRPGPPPPRPVVPVTARPVVTAVDYESDVTESESELVTDEGYSEYPTDDELRADDYEGVLPPPRLDAPPARPQPDPHVTLTVTVSKGWDLLGATGPPDAVRAAVHLSGSTERHTSPAYPVSRELTGDRWPMGFIAEIDAGPLVGAGARLYHSHVAVDLLSGDTPIGFAVVPLSSIAIDSAAVVDGLYHVIAPDVGADHTLDSLRLAAPQRGQLEIRVSAGQSFPGFVEAREADDMILGRLAHDQSIGSEDDDGHVIEIDPEDESAVESTELDFSKSFGLGSTVGRDLGETGASSTWQDMGLSQIMGRSVDSEAGDIRRRLGGME